MIQAWRLDDAAQTLVLAAHGDALPEPVYWGARLPDDEPLAALAGAARLDVTGGMLDANPPLSICPEASRSFPGQPGLVLYGHSGAQIHPRLVFVMASKTANSLALHYRDAAQGLDYRAHFRLDPAARMIEARAELDSQAPVRLTWLAAPVLPGPQQGAEIVDFAGRWCGEMRPLRSPWQAGIRLRESRAGRTDHAHFPGVILPGRGAGNTAGEVWALHYGWSGGHRMIAEELPDGRRQIQFGHAAHSEPVPGTAFASATLFACYAPDGINGCAVAFQRYLRDRIVALQNPAQPRPVHYNCWEAIYFDHSLPALRDIASRAAALGAERFVLDDGWFRGRSDDRRALGDWTVDNDKYPHGLDPLIDHVRAIGMGFGIWFEPEMVSADSDLFRAHPEWALGPADQTEGRQQRALDLSCGAVRDYLYDAIAAILGRYPVEYIKWDHNRVLPHPDAAQTRGVYALLDRVHAAFPGVEIETCASGGGRIDFGILARTQRVWLSDSNDALERLRIQHEAAVFLPACVTGSHVGPRHCHTSGRNIDIRFRAWVAAQRHFGFEMDPRELTDDETRVLRDVTDWWKHNRDWLLRADILRLDSDDASVIAEIQVSEDRSRFVVFAGRADSSAQIAPRPLRLTGLDPAARYEIRLRNRDDADAGLSRGAPVLKSGAVTLSGRYLMSSGAVLPWQFPLAMWVVEGRRLANAPETGADG